MFRIASLRCVVAALAGAIALFGCGGGDTNNSNNNATSRVRTFNALVPAAGNNQPLTITTNGTQFGNGTVQFGQFSPAAGFTTVPSGNFTPQATGAGLANPLTVNNPFVLANNNAQFTLVETGQVGTVGVTAPQFILIPNFNPNTTVIPAGQAAVQVVNLSPGSQPITLFNTVNGISNPVGVQAANIPFGFNQATNTFMFAPAGVTNFSVSSTSAVNQPIALTTSNLGSFTLQPGQAYTVFFFGQQGNATQPPSAVIVQDFP